MMENDRPLVYVDTVFDDNNLFGGKAYGAGNVWGTFFYQDTTESYNKKFKNCVRCGREQNNTIVWRDAVHHKTYCLTCVDTTSSLV